MSEKNNSLMNKRRFGRWLLCGLIALGLADLPATAATAAVASDGAVPLYGYEVVTSYPHDPNAFTEGLFFKNGVLFESTGLEGRSSVRKVRLETGEVLQQADLPPQIFGEGIAEWGGKLIGLTWKNEVGYVLDLEKFTLVGRFGYGGEGWGLTRNNRALIMSDGTAELRFLDPVTLKETRRVKVTAGGKPVDQLNELEWVE
ncbi:MAG: glutaminyl-peptide cyclotransferase, partial [Burkholderiaceae bacterium]